MSRRVSVPGEGQVRYKGNKIGGKSDRFGRNVNWQWSECYVIFLRVRLHIAE